MSTESEEPIISATTKKTFCLSAQTLALSCLTVTVILLIVMTAWSYTRLIHTNLTLTDALMRLQNTVTTQQQQTDNQLLSQAKTLAQLTQTKQDSQAVWRTLEAQHLVTLANNNLRLTNDITLAMNMLKIAAEEIAPINDVTLEPLKQALALDIEKLKNVPVVNLSQTYARLLAMNARIDKLPLLIKEKNSTPLSQREDTASLTVWQKAWHSTLQALQHIVVIRHHEKGMLALITAQAQAFFFQNIHALLTQASWALLYQQSAVYYGSLQQIIIWLDTYFVIDSPETKAVLDDLTQLQQIDIHPITPELTSLRAFQDYFAANQKGEG